jgi:site-specific DNA-cytosine methylase
MGGQGSKAGGIGYKENVSSTIKAAPSGGNQVPDIVCFHGSQDPISNTEHANAVNRNNGLENCVCQYGESAGTLTERHDSSPCADKGQNVVASHLSVRRLLPIETERLMGMSDNWTKIPWRGKPANECPDAPRYKACGNSMGVNCMRWIGLGIEAVEAKHRK